MKKMINQFNMKKIFQIILSVTTVAVVMSACHKLDVPVKSALTPEVFPTTQAQFNAVMGPIYPVQTGFFHRILAGAKPHD